MASFKAFQARIIEARDGRPRREIAARLDAIEGSDPGYSEDSIVDLEHRLRTPPANGLMLRTHCAAVDLDLVEALTALGYWPPLEMGPKQVALSALQEFCTRWGIRVAAQDTRSGRVVVQL